MEINYKILKNMESEIKTLLENQYKSTKSSLLQDSTVLQYPQANLDNCTNAVQMPLNQEGANSVAKHRLRVCVGYNDDGSQVIKQVSGKTEIELADNIAKAILNSERRNEFVGGEIVKTERMPSFRDVAEDWYATYKLPRLRGNTDSFYKQILKHLYGHWGNVPIDQISTKEIQRFLNDKRNLSEKYLREMLIVIKGIFKNACMEKLINENPADDSRLVIPSDKKTEREALSQEDITDVLKNTYKLNPSDRLYMMLIGYTGIRRGEALGLKWEDVDFEKRTISVVRGVTFPHGKNDPVIEPPKTKSGVRITPILPELMTELRNQKSDRLDDFIIGGEKPITNSIHRRMMERIKRTINLHGASSHTFRHTFATLLNNAGTDPKTIQSIIGHSDIQTTMNRYVHASEGKKFEAVAAVGNLLSNCGSSNIKQAV